MFESVEGIQNLRVVHRLFLEGNCVEAWTFAFGYVIPGSSNTWKSTVYMSPLGPVSADEVSGKVTVESTFYDDKLYIGSSFFILDYV